MQLHLRWLGILVALVTGLLIAGAMAMPWFAPGGKPENQTNGTGKVVKDEARPPLRLARATEELKEKCEVLTASGPSLLSVSERLVFRTIMAPGRGHGSRAASMCSAATADSRWMARPR